MGFFKKKRFVCSYGETFHQDRKMRIIVDSETGVNYLVINSFEAGISSVAITPLLDANGKVVVTPIEQPTATDKKSDE